MIRFCKYISFFLLILTSTALGEPTSDLWGKKGEKWDATGRLPDFSYAGYHHGEATPPTPEVTHSVLDFGATPNDEQDDSDAFIEALASVEEGVLFVPAGHYIISKMVYINKPNVVLRGAGPDKTILYFPVPLTDVKPNWGATTEGIRTSNYSWSGGFLGIKGNYQREGLTSVTEAANYGEKIIYVDNADKLAKGQEIEISLKDTPENILANYLYSGDPRISMEKLRGRTRISMVTRITKIRKNKVHLERHLRFEIQQAWQPTVNRFDSTVTESGIENIGFHFPNIPYEGHFSELGNNAFVLSQVAHCWVRNIKIHNADSGGFVSGMFNTIDGITFTSERKRDKNRKSQGHHGVTLGGSDNLMTNFDYQCPFIHDMTVSGSSGNVFSNGRGVDLALDHHRRSPYENLFTNLDAGQGKRVWRCGGGRDLGAHCGGRGTFWNIKASHTIPKPNDVFGPWSMNFVGVAMDLADQKEDQKRWYEHSTPTPVHPLNIHEAQLKKRLSKKVKR